MGPMMCLATLRNANQTAYVFLVHNSNTLSDSHALTVQRLRGAPLIWVVMGRTNTLLIAVHVLLLRSPADGSMLAKHGSNAASVLGKHCSTVLLWRDVRLYWLRTDQVQAQLLRLWSDAGETVK